MKVQHIGIDHDGPKSSDISPLGSLAISPTRLRHFGGVGGVQALTNLPPERFESLPFDRLCRQQHAFHPHRNTIMKWTAAAAKPLIEAIKQQVLSGDWGNILEPGFDPKDFQYAELRETQTEWVKAFSQKQFRQNLEKWIEKTIEEANRAGAEASDLGRGGARAEFDGDSLAGELGELEIVDEKKVNFPFKILYHFEIGTGNACATLILIVCGGQYYTKIIGNKVRFELVTKATLYDPATWLAFLPQLNSLAGGPFVEVFEKEGKTLQENPDDFEYPDRIRHYAEYEFDFDIEQNFMPVGCLPAKAEFPHPDGSKTLI